MKQIAEEIASYGRRMLGDGLVTATAGNISVRIADDEVLITPSSVPYEDIEVGDICRVDLDGHQLSPGGRQLSSEMPMHLAIYKATAAKAVVHTHSMYATTLACTVDELPAIHYHIFTLGGTSISVAGYEPVGSDGLGKAAVEALGDRQAALLANHGVIAYGASLQEAYYKASMVEWLAELYWRASVLGEPRILGDSEVNEVAKESKRRRYMRTQESED